MSLDYKDEIEKVIQKQREKYGEKILGTLNEELVNGDSDFEIVKRTDAQYIPERYGLRIRTITKSDIQKLLNGDILYWDNEYTFVIGMADKDINEV